MHHTQFIMYILPRFLLKTQMDTKKDNLSLEAPALERDFTPFIANKGKDAAMALTLGKAQPHQKFHPHH